MVPGQSSTILTHDMTTPPRDALARPAPRLIVDLAKIQSNFRRLQALAPSAEVGAVIKANAYGLGATQVVPALADAGCRTFYVAHTPEGCEARSALAGRPADIFVFNGFWPSELAALREAQLYPVLNDRQQINDLLNAAPDLPCAIHFDTGMSRLGLDARDTAALINAPASLAALDIRQIMSHLACADDATHPLNAQQLHRFAAIRAAFPGTPASLSNSAGAVLHPDYHFDILRPGIALYGGAPAPGASFEAAVEIEAPVLQVRTLRPGDTVGYGATFTASREMTIATVAAGYADGILRACGEGGMARLDNKRIPILGRVSMDLISVDLSHVDRAVQPGEPVRFLGLELDPLAAHAGAVNYELLVRLGMRFDRDYRG